MSLNGANTTTLKKKRTSRKIHGKRGQVMKIYKIQMELAPIEVEILKSALQTYKQTANGKRTKSSCEDMIGLINYQCGKQDLKQERDNAIIFETIDYLVKKYDENGAKLSFSDLCEAEFVMKRRAQEDDL